MSGGTPWVTGWRRWVGVALYPLFFVGLKMVTGIVLTYRWVRRDPGST